MMSYGLQTGNMSSNSAGNLQGAQALSFNADLLSSIASAHNWPKSAQDVAAQAACLETQKASICLQQQWTLPLDLDLLNALATKHSPPTYPTSTYSTLSTPGCSL
jgi:hypothetical protein